mgnify:CR=1 FL=1
MSKRTFSDQWHRIAAMRVGLRSGVVARLHHYSGEAWYVLHQPAHAGNFRLTPESYRFVSRLGPERTIDEIWRQAVLDTPEEAPGQEETYDLITALYRNNLLFIEGGVDEAKLIERYQRKKKKPIATRVSEMLFMRIPVWDPEPWLKRHRMFFTALWGWPLWILACLIFIWAVLEFVLAGPRVWTQAQDILQLGNLLPLYAAIFVNHLLHEMAHAIACKHFGGQVRTMGVMLLLFTPLPYVDLSSSWTFRDRLQRAWVSSAGMATDLIVGAVATITWAYSPPGMVNELAYNLMFSTAVYTFIFNINPLMRFDGYYVLSDLLGIPNLHELAKREFNRWWRSAVLGRPEDPQDAHSSGKRKWGLSLFYVGSNVYRWSVMLGIVLFVADQYWGLGLLVGAALVYSTFFMPLKQLGRPLRSPLFIHQQKRKLRASVLVILLLLAAFVWLPLPESRVLRGVVEARHNTPLFAASSAVVARVHVPTGQWVASGQLLVELENPELHQELAAVQAQFAQVLTQERKAITEASIDLRPIQERLRSLIQAREHLQAQIHALRITAPHEGLWTSPEIHYLSGTWVGRGKELGRVIDERSHVFLGVVKQEVALDWDALRADAATVRIEGERAVERKVEQLSFVPHSQKDLPSAALTPLAGGDLAVSSKDQTGRKALEQFFLLRAALLADAQSDAVTHNSRSGWLRVEMPARPLAPRVFQLLQQYFQRRYQV